MSDMCGNEELLAAYLDKRLSENERGLFEEHLSRCPGCLAELIAVKAEFDEIAAEEPETLATRSFSEMRRIRFTPLRAALSLAAVIICAGALFLSIRFALHNRVIESARGHVSRILAAADMGHMRLSGEPERPIARRVAYRGAEPRGGDEFGRMEKYLKAALARREGDWRLYALLGDLYMSDNQVERAEIFYRQALARKPGDARILNDLAAAAYRLGKFDLSRRNLESAIAADSTRLEPLYNLAVLYRESGDRANSKRYIDSYLRKDPSSAWAERARALAGE